MSSVQNINVIVRVRPTTKFAQENILLSQDNKSIQLHSPHTGSTYGPQNQKETFDFTFDSVFDNVSQEHVFQTTTAPLIAPLLDGFNGTVFAYGQTGSGKTYSIIGPSGTTTSSYSASSGLIPRTLNTLYKLIDTHPELEISVKLGFLEIYQNELSDLLSNLPINDPSQTDLKIQESSDHVISVDGQHLIHAKSEQVAQGVLITGIQNRQVAEHVLNKCSSRGHAIFTIHVETRTRYESPQVITNAKLNLVDLAGSERVKKTKATGVVMDEAKYINQSLSYLEQVIVSLEKKKVHVPFRQSKLCLLLKDSLGGNCKTSMIATISGEKDFIDETLSTLRFAARVKRLKTTLTRNKTVDPVIRVKELEREVKLLKQELAMYDAMNSNNHVAVTLDDAGMREKAKEMVQRFIDDEIDDVELKSVTFMHHLLQQFKQQVKTRDFELSRVHTRQQPSRTFSTKPSTAKPQDDESSPESSSRAVGDEDQDSNNLSFSLGHDLPPQSFDRTSSPQKSMEQSHEFHRPVSISNVASLRGVEGIKPKKEAFIDFKKGDGSALSQKLNQLKVLLKQKTAHAKVMAIKLNDLNKEIQSLREVVVEYSDEISSEEKQKVDELEQVKTMYRSVHDLFNAAKAEINSLTTNIEAIRQKLVYDFEIWYAKLFSPPSVQLAGKQGDILDEEEEAEVIEDQQTLENDPESLTYLKAKRMVDKDLLKSAI
ncbi:hypothetical protein GEMRC1_003505 [Eukaryota sp. GEM-RC1]